MSFIHTQLLEFQDEFQLLEFQGEFFVKGSFFCFLWFCCQRERYFGDTLADLEVFMVIDEMMD